MEEIDCKEHGKQKSVHVAGHDFMCYQCYYDGMLKMVKDNKVYNNGEQIKGLRLSPSYTIGNDGDIKWNSISFINVDEGKDE